MAVKTKPRPNLIKKLLTNDQKKPPVILQDQPPKNTAVRFTAYGLFKGPEGMWIMRTMEMEGTRVLSHRDNEPDIRAIQVGKIAMAMEGTEDA